MTQLDHDIHSVPGEEVRVVGSRRPIRSVADAVAVAQEALGDLEVDRPDEKLQSALFGAFAMGTLAMLVVLMTVLAPAGGPAYAPAQGEPEANAVSATELHPVEDDGPTQREADYGNSGDGGMSGHGGYGLLSRFGLKRSPPCEVSLANTVRGTTGLRMVTNMGQADVPCPPTH